MMLGWLAALMPKLIDVPDPSTIVEGKLKETKQTSTSTNIDLKTDKSESVRPRGNVRFARV